MIKKLFPLLLCYVLMQTQAFALSGGPVYGNSGSINTIGLYSGVLQGVTESGSSSGGPAIPGDPVPGGIDDTSPSNALGIFDLSVPGTTTATGAFLLFANGVVFSGSIAASVDPDNAKLSGILQGTFGFSILTANATGTVTTVAVNADALGQLTAQITASRTGAISAARLNGSATLDINFGEIDTNSEPVIVRSITFTVSGYQTTTNIQAASTIGTLLTAGTGGSGT